MSEKADVKSSRMQKGRKTINYLQKLKDEGTPIVQMCPGPRDQFWTMAAEMADVDICRLTVPGDGSDPEMQIKLAPYWIKCVRNAAKIIHINFYMDDTLYVSVATAWSDLYNLRTGSVIVPVGSLRKFDGMSPTKIIFVGQPHETLEQQERWRAEFDGSVYIVRTCTEYLEFLNPVANKWEGIKVVADRYGIAYDRIAAFGDSPNDLPMLKHAAVSVVMPHADPEALAEADYVPEGAADEAFAVAVEDMANGRWP